AAALEDPLGEVAFAVAEIDRPPAAIGDVAAAAVSPAHVDGEELYGVALARRQAAQCQHARCITTLDSAAAQDAVEVVAAGAGEAELRQELAAGRAEMGGRAGAVVDAAVDEPHRPLAGELYVYVTRHAELDGGVEGAAGQAERLLGRGDADRFGPGDRG